MKIIKLSQDNSWNNIYNQRGLEIDKNILENELQVFFKWRTPTKKINTFTQRFFRLGSKDYDSFINYLINKGY